MILDAGSKVLIVHRRLFLGDAPRHFVGSVDAYEHGLVRVSGYTLMFDSLHNSFALKRDERTKVVPITSGTVIVYQLPRSIVLESMHIRMSDGRTLLCDDADFEMDITERYQNEPGSARTA